MIVVEMEFTIPQETPMVHDVILAAVFLAMVIAPALLTMRGSGEENE